MVLVRVEGDRSAEGIGQRSAAVGVCDYDNGGSGMPCPFIAASVPVMNGMPSASIAHIAATGGWPVR
jgi:hypothetical protein